MKKVRDNSAVPRVAWKYINPEDGQVITDIYFHRLNKTVKKYRRANNYPIGSNFEQDFEENICANAPGDLCMEFTPPTLLQKMTKFAQAMARATMHVNRAIVSTEEAQKRKDICASCNFYGGSPSFLKIACRHCGCSGIHIHFADKHCPLPQPKW